MVAGISWILSSLINVEIALLQERNRVLELEYELEMLRATSQWDKSEKQKTALQRQNSVNVVTMELKDVRDKLAAVEAMKQKKKKSKLIIFRHKKVKQN